jgi:hypothetical protein
LGIGFYYLSGRLPHGRDITLMTVKKNILFN